MNGEPGARGGFSLIEVIIAMMILAVGMLGMAASSSWTSLEVRASALRTQRMAAISAAIEQARGRAYTSAAFDALSGTSPTMRVGRINVWYDVVADPNIAPNPTATGKIIRVYTQATAIGAQPDISTAVDTFVTELSRPFR